MPQLPNIGGVVYYHQQAYARTLLHQIPPRQLRGAASSRLLANQSHVNMVNTKSFQTALDMCHKSTVVGNTISIHMLELIGTAKERPAGFVGLAREFLELCRIMWAIEAGLNECRRTGQSFPADVVAELDKRFKSTNNDFQTLDHMISRYIDYERKGTMGKIQRGWRKMFSEDEVAKMSAALGATRDSLKMSALMFQWQLGGDKIDDSVGIGYTGLEAALDRLDHKKAKTLSRANSDQPYSASPTANHSVQRDLPLTPDDGALQLPPLSPVGGLDKLSLGGPEHDGDRSSHMMMSQVGSAHSQHQQHQQPHYQQHQQYHQQHQHQAMGGGLSQATRSTRRPASISNHTLSEHGGSGSGNHSNGNHRETHETFASHGDSAVSGLTEAETLLSDGELSDGGPVKVKRLKADPSTMPRWSPRKASLPPSASYRAALISAVQTRNSTLVEQLLDRGVAPDTGPDGHALNEAMVHHDLESARHLLMYGADVGSPDGRGVTPLTTAVEHSFLDGAALLLKYGADPNLAAGLEPESPLAVAVAENRFNFMRLLLMYGGDANSHMANGETILIRAISKKWSARVIDLLLDYGADPDGKTREGVSPLFAAINSGRADTVTSLLDHGANPNLPGPKHMLWPAIHQIACLQVLLARGADYRKAPGIMEQAASTNNIEAVRVLLERGVDPNAKKDGTYTPLCTSIRDDRRDIFHLLLDKGADPNVPASEYPAFKTVTHFRPYYLPHLVAAGADLRSPKGILETAVTSKNRAALLWLLEHGRVPINDRAPRTGATALTAAIRLLDEDLIDLLLDKGADANVRGEDWPVFMAVKSPSVLRKILPRLKDPRAFKGVMERAVVNGHLESVKLLIAAGVSVEDRNGGVFSPLTSAIRDRKPDIVRYLLTEAGADVNAPGEHLPIIKALRRYEGDDYEVLEMVLAAGADPNKVYRGHSGFVQAIENGDPKVLRLLVGKCDVDFEARDENGMSIVELAESRGWDEGVGILERKRAAMARRKEDEGRPDLIEMLNGN